MKTDTAGFVNGIHYDNDSTDVGGAIEIAGPSGFQLPGCQVVLYNGDGGAPYDADPLTGTIGDSHVVVPDYPSNGIANGSPDGLALVDAAGPSAVR